MNECEMALSRMIDLCLDAIDNQRLSEEDREWYRNELRKFEDMIPERSESAVQGSNGGQPSGPEKAGPCLP